MKALILSCGTGGGHNAAGRAIKEELERRGDSVLMLNPYDLAGKHTAKRIDETCRRLRVYSGRFIRRETLTEICRSARLCILQMRL